MADPRAPLCLLLCFSAQGIWGEECAPKIFKLLNPLTSEEEFSSLEALSPKKRLLATRARFIQSPKERTEAPSRAGFNPSEIASLKRDGALDSDILEYRRLTTLLPLMRPHIRPGLLASRPNARGVLETVRIRRVQGNHALVSVPDASGNQKVVGMERVALSSIYRPLEVYKQVLYRAKNDPLPEIFAVKNIDNRNGLAVLSSMDGTRKVQVYLRQLALKPRPLTDVTTKDVARVLSPREETSLREAFHNLWSLHREKGEGSDFAFSNNKLIKKIRTLLAKQGISSALTPSFSAPGVLELVINGALPWGNLPLRRLIRFLEVQGSEWLTVSFVENIRMESAGFFDRLAMRLDLGHESLLDLLAKREKSMGIDIAYRHAVSLKVEGKRRDGRGSLFDYSFVRSLGPPPSFYDNPDTVPESRFVLSELYAMVIELREIVERIPHEAEIDDFINSSLERGLAEYLADIESVAKNIKQFSEGEEFHFTLDRDNMVGDNFTLKTGEHKVVGTLSPRTGEERRRDLKIYSNSKEEAKSMARHFTEFRQAIEKDINKILTISDLVLGQVERIERAFVNEGRVGLRRETRRLALILREINLAPRALP